MSSLVTATERRPSYGAPHRFKATSKVFARTWESLRALQKIRKQYPGAISDESRPLVQTVMREWCRDLFEIMNLKIEKTGAAIEKSPCLFLSNHMGYLDIPVMMALTEASFVSKKEVKSWPLFGASAAAAGTLFVDRSSPTSRRHVARAIGECVRAGQSLVLFPEGTSSTHGKPWKKGAFSIAMQYKFPVQPVRLLYRPLRKCAYIDKDLFVPHLWRLLGERQVEVYAEVHEPVWVTDPQADMQRLQAWVQDSFNQKLRDVGEGDE